LDRARRDQELLRAGQAAGQGRDGEQAEPEQEEPAVAKEVAQPAAEQEKAAEGDQVGVHHPGERGLRKAQILSNRGEGDVHDRRVEDDHEVAEAKDEEREPARAALQAHGAALLSSRSCMRTSSSCVAQPKSLVIPNLPLSAQAEYTLRVTTRTYGQYCGIACALELVGERWALLIVRDLILSPKRFTELQRGLPRIPSNVLSARLKELEHAEIVCRRLLPRPEAGVVYELTEYGRELEDAVLRLGLWGARSLAEPRPEDVVTADSLQLALRATFRPKAARGLKASYELRLGEIVLHARVDNGALEVGEGPLPEADLSLETDLTIRALMTGELSPREALKTGRVRVKGKRALLERFVELFHIPPRPAVTG
jgi:DNA-binding HxlR family transcriptional regulator/putative sterol carrier protein